MKKLVAILRLMLSFAVELVMSNIAIVRIICHPKLPIRPGIIAYNTKVRTDVGLTALSNLITLTPGTLTLDISDDRSTLFIHTLAIEDSTKVCESIRRAFETHILVLES
jgi:multicomponent Na+:H+ antiporter subunit E